ncbi:MAG: carboxylesterase family protein, partial [Fluviibacter sp.]
ANKEDQAMAETMGKSWAAFARTGNPNYVGGAEWPRYDFKNDVMREFTTAIRLWLKISIRNAWIIRFKRLKRFTSCNNLELKDEI